VLFLIPAILVLNLFLFPASIPALLPLVADCLERKYRLAGFVTATATVKWLFPGLLLLYTIGAVAYPVVHSRDKS
jgi:hypothetical protein